MVKGVPQLRSVNTPNGLITYTLLRKPVKNLNLRIGRRGEVAVSLPVRCSLKQADDFVLERSRWILDAIYRQAERQVEPLPSASQEVCAQRLSAALKRVYPLVEPLGIAFPHLKIRSLKSQWGNCHWAQGYITLNIALARCPEELRDYVALHELVHFLHQDHGTGFYTQMDVLMPDWQQRRKALKSYSGALEDELIGKV